jgi:hypothetical protein
MIRQAVKHAQQYFQHCRIEKDIQTLPKRTPQDPARTLQEKYGGVCVLIVDGMTANARFGRSRPDPLAG